MLGPYCVIGTSLSSEEQLSGWSGKTYQHCCKPTHSICQQIDAGPTADQRAGGLSPTNPPHPCGGVWGRPGCCWASESALCTYLANQEHGEHGIDHKGCCPRATQSGQCCKFFDSYVLTRSHLQHLGHHHRRHELRHGGGLGEERVGSGN